MRLKNFRTRLLFVVVCLASATLPGRGQGINSGQLPASPPSPPRDPVRELEMKITGSFTLASVGDLMIKRPVSMRQDPDFQNVFQIIRSADVAIGNMEGELGDIKDFQGPMRGMMGTHEVAADLKALGFTMVNRANNHIFDSDKEGMFSTNALLEEAGVVYAGAGKNLEDARAPAYLDTPKGRIAVVGMHTPHNRSNSAASYRVGNTGGRPGLNALNLTTYYIVSQDQLDALKQIRRAAYTPPPGTTNATRLPDKEPADRVQLFDTWYKVGPNPGTKSYVMNPADLREILRSIRNGKTLSHFLIATIHAHQGPVTAQQWLMEDQTPDFLIELAHKAIDNGADAFVGHGPHVLRGVEIYKGKPIFYGLGEFFYQWQHMDATIMSGSWTSRPLADETMSDVRNNNRAINFESVIALSRYDRGKLVEVRLLPTDGRFDGPIVDLGIPRSSPPEIAQRILSRLQTLSKPFGTAMTIEGNVGVIRVAQATSTASER